MNKIISTDDIDRVEMYIDASFGSHEDDEGHSALVTMVGSLPQLFSNIPNTRSVPRTRQRLIGINNSTESELVALFNLFIVGCRFYVYLQCLGVPLKIPIILQHNKSIDYIFI